MRQLIAVACILMCVLPTGGVLAEEAPPEVVAARSSAKEHNRRVNHAQAELEEVIERAKKKYNEQVIQAKERLIMDLRRTLRNAAESDRPENLIAISQQIERLDSQIQTLRNGPAAQAKPDANRSDFGLYKGTWSLTWPNGHKRSFDIDASGRVEIRSNSSGSGPGSGVDSTYQAKLIKGGLAFHDRNWTKGDRIEGRVILLKRHDDESVTIGYSERNLEESDTFKTADEVWKAKLSDVYSRDGKEKAKPVDHKEPDDKKDKPTVKQDDPVVVETDLAEDRDADGVAQQGDTFFGIPLE